MKHKNFFWSLIATGLAAQLCPVAQAQQPTKVAPDRTT